MDYGVIDARVSTELQERGYSLDGQVKAALAYAARHDIFIPSEYIFQESHTGTDIDRPVIKKIREILREDKRVKYVIVYSLDRLARTALGLLLLEKEFRKAGAKVVYIKYEFDDTPEGQLQKQIYAAFSEFEKATITHRFAKGKRDKVASGTYLGGHNSPYGYFNDVHVSAEEHRHAKTNFLKVNPEEARILRHIFEWLVYGDEDGDGAPLTATGVARKLTEMHVPSPYSTRCPKYKKRKTPDYQWNTVTITNIVRNPVYHTGIWVYGKTQKRNGVTIQVPRQDWVSVRVPSLIDPELWRAAGHQLEVNRKRTAPFIHNPYLLASRVSCAICGKPMNGGTSRGHHRYYYCSGHHLRQHAFNREECCKSRYVHAELLEDLVWGWLHKLFSDRALVLQGLKERQSEQLQRQALTIGRLESVKEELARVNAEMKALIMGFAKDKLAEDSPAYRIFSESLKQFNAQAQDLEREQAKIEVKLSQTVLSDDAVARAKRALEDVDLVFADGNLGKRQAFLNMLDVIVVVKADPGQEDIQVEASCCVKPSGVMHMRQAIGGNGRRKRELMDGSEGESDLQSSSSCGENPRTEKRAKNETKGETDREPSSSYARILYCREGFLADASSPLADLAILAGLAHLALLAHMNPYSCHRPVTSALISGVIEISAGVF